MNAISHDSFIVASVRDVCSGAHAHRIAQSWPAVNASADGIALISHELRNSLGVVRNAARLLRQPVGAAGIERARILIERQVGQMSRHIEHMLDPVAREQRKPALQLSYLDLRTILENSAEAIAADFARRGHRLLVTLPADAVWLNADGPRLEQVFLNLLINAAKYTPDFGKIELTVERVEGHARVRIRDSGIGIAPAQLTRIFDLFVQVEPTTKFGESGSGIGLTVVRDLVEMHGGTVRATSAGLSLGSEFVVLLPASSGL